LIKKGRPPLTPALQFMFLRANPICRGDGKLHATGLIWTYRTRPTPLSREYEVEIRMRRGDTPDVFITDPDLSALAGGRPLPHVYRNPTRLCLTLPKAREWTPAMRIDRTFVPWATTWLYYFEEWLASDDWKGGGEHPSSSEPSFNRQVRRAVR
jgi:hypothetical protein